MFDARFKDRRPMTDREARDELFALNDRLSTFVDGEAVWVTASIIRHACRLLEAAEAERDRALRVVEALRAYRDIPSGNWVAVWDALDAFYAGREGREK